MSSPAFVFPGQGSQSVGMLADLAAEWPCVRETFDQASVALGHDMWRLVQQDPDQLLDHTQYTQPAMLTAGVAVLQVWREAGGPAPACVAGHSLGEYSALVAAGVLDLDSALRVVAERARLMQNAVPQGQGAMAAILGLNDEMVRSICESAQNDDVVEPVNFNAPGQVVIAGHAVAVKRAMEEAQRAGAKRAVKLPVSVPAHSRLMETAADSLAETLAGVEFTAPAVRVVHNVDAASHAAPEKIRDTLRRQLYNPVRWTDSVNAMAAMGVHRFVELGPGRVLAGMTRRIDRSLQGLPVDDPASLNKALQQCAHEEA